MFRCFDVSAANRGQPCLGRRRAKQRNPRDVVSGIGRKTFLLILKDFCRCLTDFSQLYLLHVGNFQKVLVWSFGLVAARAAVDIEEKIGGGRGESDQCLQCGGGHGGASCTCWWYSLCHFPYRQHDEKTGSDHVDC